MQGAVGPALSVLLNLPDLRSVRRIWRTPIRDGFTTEDTEVTEKGPQSTSREAASLRRYCFTVLLLHCFTVLLFYCFTAVCYPAKR